MLTTEKTRIFKTCTCNIVINKINIDLMDFNKFKIRVTLFFQFFLNIDMS